MATLTVDWVPRGAWLAPGYAEWPAPPSLRDSVACLWARVAASDGDGGTHDGGTSVLPDACSDLIWEQDVGAYMAGPDTGPWRSASRPGAVFVGVRFRPAAGGPALGMPLSEIRDQRAGLSDLLPGAAKRLPAALHPAEAAARTLDIAGLLIADGTPDAAVTRAAALLRDPAARSEDVAAQVGLSMRQLRRRCHAAIGYGPKTLQRVLRFQRFVRGLDASAGSCDLVLDLAAVAAEVGYADQAHLTRECNALSGIPPAALSRTRPPPAPASPRPASPRPAVHDRGYYAANIAVSYPRS
jgi:AraC-like DNA-binding protein